MWSVAKPEDGPCADPTRVRDRFRYPIGTIPGNVISLAENHQRLYEPGTILYQIFEEIIPFIMGALVILFFMCTTFYMGFSLLRLFYSDTLKPYKTRTLKALGKHHHHYRRRDSGSSFSISETTRGTGASGQSVHARWSKNLRKTSIEMAGGVEGEDGRPLDHTISTTSPPQRTLKPGEKPGEYPAVADLLGQASNLPMLTRFPADNDRMFAASRGRGGVNSQIPILQNRKGNLWAWSSTWYRKQVVDEKATGKALEALQSTHSVLHESTSVHGPPEQNASMPTLTPPANEGLRPLGPLKPLLEKEVPVKQEESHPNLGEVYPREPPPPLTLPRPPPPVLAPPPPSPRPLTPVTPASHTDLLNRYTFKLKPAVTVSALKTAIPKAEKKTWQQQFMILRGGPRRTAAAIEEIKKKRASGDGGQPEAVAGDKKGEVKNIEPLTIKSQVRFENEKWGGKQ